MSAACRTPQGQQQLDGSGWLSSHSLSCLKVKAGHCPRPSAVQIFVNVIHFIVVMAEPISVIASITGLLAVTAKVAALAKEYIQKERNAPGSMSNVLQEMSDFSICLNQLQPFIQGTRTLPTPQRAAISRDQLIVMLSSSVVNLAKLEEIMDTFQTSQPLSVSNRVRWTRRETEVTELLTQIRASRSSLNLMLTIFNW